ncbi:GTPase Era [Robiginitalea sp. M366]|uniref:GTPase Era n=1 Tax=Robiginitalea aestuariiviva TaxID=3036903 RepID=UPI00240DE473|nr:GTPase Era [Robiginitalea aestuariiviva]MDG1571956.1 GTPase Era [Robiginitalea aestuariiviva]
MSAHKSGFVNIVGNPNVGKSTLMNALVGERLSIITPKAQTTRHRILGIVNGEDFQVVFSDTPGVIQPAYQLQASMMDFVRLALEDADVLLYMVEIGEKQLKDQALMERIRHTDTPVLVLINKIDTSNQEFLEAQVAYWQETLPKAEVHPISALEGFGVQQVMDRIRELLPEAPPYFPKDQLTDKPERFFVGEIIREKILEQYQKEVPYSVEVVTESFEEEEALIRIGAVINVERDSQKGILIGHKGSALKRLGTAARKDLEAFFGKQVFLQLFVKVSKDWRSSERHLRGFGYSSK